MKLGTFDVDVVQKVLTVFEKDKLDPFETFSDPEIQQGFSWRPGSVTFFTFEDADPARVAAEFHLDEQREPSAQAERVIQVPFTVAEGKSLDVTGIYEAEERDIAVPPGDYCLVAELGHGPPQAQGEDFRRLWARFTFVPSTCEAKILRVDPELDPPAKLIVGSSD